MHAAALAWIVLDRAAGDIEGQVHRAVRERVLTGQLVAGQRLPSTRDLAAALGIARSTVVQAYERLRAEGFLDARAGSATRVAALPAPPRRPLRPAASIPVSRPSPDPGGIFRPGVPDLADFPHAAWARCLGARARALRLHDLGYGEATGLATLREAVLAHVSATRGVAATADQVIILPSTRAGIDLVARLVIRPGDTAWIEEPGYDSAQRILQAAGARLVPVPCDGEGLLVGDGALAPPRLIAVTPSHQYPTGVTMSLPRRLAVLDVAEAAGAVVVEDDYDSEFQYGSPPIAALQGIDRGDCVAYLGTFAKVLAPGLRVAYAILPHRLLAEARAMATLRGLSVPIHVQAALADFLREGHLRAHIRRMAARYAERMALTAAALERACGDHLLLGPGTGGLQLAAWFRDPGRDDRAVAQALAAHWLGARALSELHLGPPRPGLLFGIARATPEAAAKAACLIREAVA